MTPTHSIPVILKRAQNRAAFPQSRARVFREGGVPNTRTLVAYEIMTHIGPNRGGPTPAHRWWAILLLLVLLALGISVVGGVLLWGIICSAILLFVFLVLGPGGLARTGT